MGEPEGKNSNRSQLALTFGVIAAVFVLVLALYPIILKRSPLGDVVREAGVGQALSEMNAAMDAFELILTALESPDGLVSAWPDGVVLYGDYVDETVAKHSVLLYDLLRNGSSATSEIPDAVRSRLSQRYLDLGKDPWGANYRFYIGPWSDERHEGVSDAPFVSFWRAATRSAPEGIRAPADLKLYIYSLGPDGISSQPFASGYDKAIAGDDVGLWDKAE